MWEVENYLCFKLHTAGKVIGWVCFLCSLFATMTYIYIFANLDEIMENIDQTVYYDEFANHQYPEQFDVIKEKLKYVLPIMIGYGVLEVIITALLIVGATKKNRMLLLPWLITQGISLTMSFFFVFIILYVSLRRGIGAGIIPFMFWFFAYYTWTAIYSLYKSIKRSERGGAGLYQQPKGMVYMYA